MPAPDKAVRLMLQTAYRVADEEQCNVFLVMTPQSKREATEKLAYVVLEPDATDWERTNGIHVHFRYSKDGL